MKYLAFLFIFLSFTASAQKVTTEIFDAGSLNTIILNSDEIFKVVIRTAPVHSVTVKSKTDGEYFNNISLATEVHRNTLLLESRFREILQSGFDKLSAHKVFSMELELEIPEDMNLEIKSNVASVFLRGNYNRVLIQLKTGSAFVEDFTGNAVINTYDGNIDVKTENAQFDAQSRHGIVTVPKSKWGNNQIKLTSINGNIKARETK